MFGQLVEGTEGEAFSAAFINPPWPESAPSILSSTSGAGGSSAQGRLNYPAIDSGLVLEGAKNAEVGNTGIPSRGEKGKEEEKGGEEEEEDDMEMDESVVDDSEQEEAEYDSSVSLDY